MRVCYNNNVTNHTIMRRKRYEKIKFFKKIIAVVLCLVMSAELSITTFAQTNSQINMSSIHNVDIYQMKLALESDSLVKEVWIEDDTLQYITQDNTHTSIKINVNNNKQIITITENQKENVVIVDENNNRLYLDNEIVEVNPEIVYENIPSTYSTYIYMSTTHPNIVAEKEIRSLSASILFTLMFSALGGVGVVLSIAQAIITAAINIASSTKTVYVTRKMYHDNLYTTLKYVDSYYAKSNYTSLLKSNTSYVYQ